MENRNRRDMAVIGIFNHIGDAQQASVELQSQGFGSQINLIENDLSTVTDPADRAENKGGIREFFSNLFSLDDNAQGSYLTGSERKLETSEDLEATETWGLDPESERYLTEAYHQGRHLVLVYVEDDQERVKHVLEACRGEVLIRSRNFTKTEDLSQQEGVSDQDLIRSEEEVMRLREEELVAEKQAIQTGEVRAHKETVTEVKNIEVPVEREEVVIERRRLNGDEVSASADDRTMEARSEKEEIRIPVSQEQVHVEKKVVPREEVSISKQKVQETKQYTEELQREEAHIESEGRVAMKNKGKADRKDKKYQRPPEAPPSHQPSI